MISRHAAALQLRALAHSRIPVITAAAGSAFVAAPSLAGQQARGEAQRMQYMLTGGSAYLGAYMASGVNLASRSFAYRGVQGGFVGAAIGFGAAALLSASRPSVAR
jgi:hypothetical protein